MTDRELLELAAKAAGIDLKPMQINNVREQGDDRFVGYMTDPEQWSRGWFNPLTDDGDAFRLAVKLKLDVFFHPDRVEAHISGRKMIASKIFREEFKFCGNDSTRRSIVRAAAEIGKQMGGRL